MMKREIIASVLALTALVLGAGAEEKPVYFCQQVFTAPQIDGKLDETIWGQAPLIGDLVNDDTKTAKFATQCRMLWDQEALYVAVVAAEPNPKNVEVYPGNPSKAFSGDNIELFYDPGQTRGLYYQLAVTPAGEIWPVYCNDAPQLNFKAEIVPSYGTDSWTLEMRIPFGSLGRSPTLGARWGFDMGRSRAGKSREDKGEYSFWSPGCHPYASPAKFGTLVFCGTDLSGAQPVPEKSATERLLEVMTKALRGEERWGGADISYTGRNVRAHRLLSLTETLNTYPGTRLLYWIPPAIRLESCLPWSVPEVARLGGQAELTVCRGEFEPLALDLFAVRELKGVSLSLSELVSTSGVVLPATVADPFHVIPWYQYGLVDNYAHQPIMVTETLMKDPTLITPDPVKRRNKLNFERAPRDAATLQPVDIPAFESRELWVTYRIPPQAQPGFYAGAITISDSQGPCATIPVKLRVPAWELAPSPLLHGFYYTRGLPKKMDTIEEENAFFLKMEREIKDQAEHGCNIFGSYVHARPLLSDPSPFASINLIDALQKKYGVKGTPYFCVVNAVGTMPESALPQVEENSRKMADWAKEHGRECYVFQGMDEAGVETQKRELPGWAAVRKGGSRMFVAGGDVDTATENLAFPVVGGCDSSLPKKGHIFGARILSYAAPFTGSEMPLRYRRYYGLNLLALGYDGALNWCYGDTEENPNGWDEFIGGQWRNTTFAYAGMDGPVDTVEYEGWREGIDDIRYAATLRLAINQALAQGRQIALAHSLEQRLNGLTGQEPDLDALRAEITRGIDQLTP